MRVLVACEFSGIVRDAFIAAGHTAMSVDLLPSERPGPHIQTDVLRFIAPGRWDMMIAHPPCTYLANSGVRWLYKGGKAAEFGEIEADPDRYRLMRESAEFFRALLNAPIPHIAIENPIQHRHAQLPRPDQIIQPWQFGHGEVKATCLWLKGLPKLVPTDIVDGRTPRVHHASPGPDRWKERSRTLPGIAAAMAAQWGTETAGEAG